MRWAIAFLGILGLAGTAWGQAVDLPDGDAIFDKPEAVRIKTLTEPERRHLMQQRQLVDDLARRHLGRSLRGSPAHDLPILQTLLDEGHVTAEQTYALQALGVILGDLYAAEFPMQWVSYRDDAGQSRALRIGDTEEVLFPITMISRRVEAGIDVDVKAVYEKGAAIARDTLGGWYRPPTPPK